MKLFAYVKVKQHALIPFTLKSLVEVLVVTMYYRRKYIHIINIPSNEFILPSGGNVSNNIFIEATGSNSLLFLASRCSRIG